MRQERFHRTERDGAEVPSSQPDTFAGANGMKNRRAAPFEMTVAGIVVKNEAAVIDPGA